MNADLLSLLKTFTAAQGEAALADPRRVRSHLSDYGAEIPRAQKNALIRCLEYGFYADLKNAPAGERAALKDRLARKLRDGEGLEAALCEESLDLLERALFGESPPAPAPAGITAEEQGGTEAEEPAFVPAIKGPPSSAAGGAEIPGPGSPALPRRDYEKKRREAAILEMRLDKTNKGLTAAIIIGILALSISIGIGVYFYNDVNDSLYSQYSRYNSLESRYKELQSNYDTVVALVKNSIIDIRSLSVGNCEKNNRWINKPGEELKASDIRYLKPVITYNSQASKEVTLFVKIINPDGTVRRYEESLPPGYSYADTITISRGNDRTWELTGWGNEDQSNYGRGNYRVEVWYEGACLAAAAVALN
ncbi:MAG: hypothetical protein LBH26_00460 [Treponema sp.]|jgi:hypothetical protein|nr:hypothetical protein [Treponema sp.]